MAKVSFIETTSSKLDSLPIVEGRFTFVSDTGEFYRDTANAHIEIGGSSSSDSLIAMSVTDNILVIVTKTSKINITADDELGTLTFEFPVE